MLLRDEAQLAMNAVETSCFEAADHYESASDQVGNPQVARLFGERGNELRMTCAQLAGHIRRLDDLPQQPDPDRETVSEVLSGIKAFLSGAPEHALIDQQLELEHKLIQAIEAALRVKLPEATQSLLQSMIDEAQRAKGELEGLRPHP